MLLCSRLHVSLRSGWVSCVSSLVFWRLHTQTPIPRQLTPTNICTVELPVTLTKMKCHFPAMGRVLLFSLSGNAGLRTVTGKQDVQLEQLWHILQ